MEPNQSEVVMPINTEASKPRSSYGVLVALVIIVAIVVGGAYYLLSQRLGETMETPEQASVLDELGTQSDSTDPTAIETDLAAESPDEFNAELDAAFNELDRAFTE